VPGYIYKHYEILCTGGAGRKYQNKSIASYCESASREKMRMSGKNFGILYTASERFSNTT
jgi:hypothetical protein